MQFCPYQVVADTLGVAKKVRTLKEEQILIVIGFCKGSAFLLQQWPDRRPTIHFAGPRFKDLIAASTKITIANHGLENFAIALKCRSMNKSTNQALIFATEEPQGEPGGCVLIFGRPDSEKLHVRLITRRSNIQKSESYKLNDPSDIWIIQSVCEPLFISYGFRLNWQRLAEEIYSVRYRRIT